MHTSALFAKRVTIRQLTATSIVVSLLVLVLAQVVKPLCSWPPPLSEFFFVAISLHFQLCTAPAPNAFLSRVPIPSRLHFNAWSHLLSDFSDNVICEFCEFLEFLEPINYTSPTPSTPVSHNHPSACNHPVDVHQFIAKEVQLQATAGPFSVTPFSCNFMTSPLLTVPKKDFTSHHIVMDLSFPLGSSVNDGIPKDTFLDDPFQLHLPSIHTLVALIQKFGKGCLLFKKDLCCAYRQLSEDPRDYHYLG